MYNGDHVKFTVWVSKEAAKNIALDGANRFTSRKAIAEQILEFYGTLSEAERKRFLDESTKNARPGQWSWKTRKAAGLKN